MVRPRSILPAGRPCAVPASGYQGGRTAVRYTHELTENLHRMHCRYHPRETELGARVDEAYVKRLEALRVELQRARKNTVAIRAAVRRWYERRRRKRV